MHAGGSAHGLFIAPPPQIEALTNKVSQLEGTLRQTTADYVEGESPGGAHARPPTAGVFAAALGLIEDCPLRVDAVPCT